MGHKPLHVLGAAVIFVETQDPQVPVELTVGVAGSTCDDRALSLDHQRSIPRLPRPGIVLFLEPVGDDGVATPDHLFALIPGMVCVGGVLRKQGGDSCGVVGAPGIDVSVEPSLNVVVGHPSASSFHSSYDPWTGSPILATPLFEPSIWR
jgi:hypothetical protein